MAKPRGARRAARREVDEAIAALEALAAAGGGAGARPELVRAKRDAFARLVRHMTSGVDMSAAFVPAMKCVALSRQDLPLKKMHYLFLRSAARANPETALLVVQAMLNDCADADPALRGLAVRSMASLRVPDLLENVIGAVGAGLRDAHPYVREVRVVVGVVGVGVGVQMGRGSN
jgi:vesicle coat complex subunit